MKILYLKLKNYASIYTAMGLKELEIDFTKSKNSIILFVGDNGSGKTSLLSTLHPFAYYGSMDPRSNTSILREDKDGYKEIHIQYNEDIYKIQHHYKNTKRGILLKSFIQKNDEELNPNGNVTSFNETIKNELSLELDFLRLLRLGSNVTNLIDMRAAERKSFTSYLLTDISMYNELFKKVSEDNRILKNMIRTVSDKLVKLNVLDESVLKSDISVIENKLNDLNNSKDKVQHDIGIVEGKITSIAPEGIESVMSEIKELKKDLNIEKNKIITAKSYLSKLCIILVCDINEEIEIVTKEINRAENEKELNSNMILFYKEQLNGLYNKKSDLENILKVTVSDVTFKEMTELYANLLAKLNQYEKKYKNNTPIYTKDNILTLLEVLNQINNIINETHGFDGKAITKVIDLLRNSQNVDSYVNSRRKEIDKDIMKINAELNNSINLNNPSILFRPSNCPEDKCPYFFLYELIFSNNKKSDKSIISLNNEKELLDNMSYVKTNIDYIFMILNTNKSLISKGNIPYFRIDNVFNSLLTGKSLYDEDVITDMISDVEEYEEYLSLITKVKELKTELNLLKSNSSIIESTKKELDSIEIEIQNIIEKISDLESKNKFNEHWIQGRIKYRDSLFKFLEHENTIDISNKNIQSIEELIANKVSIFQNVSILNNESKDLHKKLDLINWEIDKYNNELFNLKVKLKDFISLSEEHNILNEKFDDVNILRESLSATKGIPLLYMQLYLKNTKMFVNDLLRVVYSDNFEIDDFDINETEFNIPYIKNNIRISDVMYASQGEKSFLSLALSFALINQSIKDYNILLLDEIDSTLDTRNRAMFLNILEKQMESINSEQVFLITHNNVFENFPVDLIVTTKNKDINYSNANIIWSV